LTRIQQFDRKKHYGLCVAVGRAYPHHHITCIKCGKVDEIKECAIDIKKKIKGYTVVSHFMQVNGVCTGCSNG
jgi:Fe2+ or Zn2+ uptake regulation protein